MLKNRKKPNLEKDPLKSTLLYYIFPAVSAMLILSAHILIDGIFIGRGIGGSALAPVNLCLPIYMFFMGAGLLIGFGGGTVISVKHGEGDFHYADNIFTLSVIGLLFFSIPIAVTGFLFSKDIASLLGAEGKLLQGTIEYMKMLFAFSPFIILTESFQIFVRNDNNPVLAMGAIVSSVVFNTIFNYIFIFILGWGLHGAALGTGLSHIISLSVLLVHFTGKRGKLKMVTPVIKTEYFIRILKNGATGFITEISQALVILVFNAILLNKMGQAGVSAYCIINYMMSAFICLAIGMGQGMQPVVSFNYGANRNDRVSESFLFVRNIALATGVLFLLITLLFSGQFISFFVPNDLNLISMTEQGLKIFNTAYPFMGINIVIISLFQSIENARQAMLLSLSRGCILVILGLIVYPLFFGIEGVWMSVPVAEFFTLFAGIFMYRQWGKGMSGMPI